jgi:hypothetical protein
MKFTELIELLVKDDFEAFLKYSNSEDLEIGSIALLAYNYSAKRCLYILFLFYSLSDCETEKNDAVNWNLIKTAGKAHLASSNFVEKIQNILPERNFSCIMLFVQHYILNINLYEQALQDSEIQTKICIDLLEGAMQRVDGRIICSI